jgi:hypothetical protein
VIEGHDEDNNSYAIVEVHPNRNVTVTGWRKAPSTESTHVSGTRGKPSPSFA